MAAGKMCLRRSKEETAEVWLTAHTDYIRLPLHLISLCIGELMFNAVLEVCPRRTRRRQGRHLVAARSQQVALGPRDCFFLSPVFFFSRRLCLRVCQSGQGYSSMSWRPSRSRSSSSRGWWRWRSPPSPTSGGFFQRTPTDPDIWKVNTTSVSHFTGINTYINK